MIIKNRIFSLILFTILFVFFVGCTPFIVDSIDETTYNVPTGFTSPEEIIAWIEDNTMYHRDDSLYGLPDYWASPEEVIANKGGDCEDLACLYLYMVYVNLGEKGTFFIMTNENETVWHGVGESLGVRYYDSWKAPIEFDRLSFKEAMNKIGRAVSVNKD